MSFDPRFSNRFEQIIRPAIEKAPLCGYSLQAYRVDNSRTGDSILTDIVDGIAHARLVLADLSDIDEGGESETPIRNGNVMYEVGVALAARQPSEVLLVRGDRKRFLFDVSTIPHQTIDFDDPKKAIADLQTALADRIRETELLNDARIQLAARSLTREEINLLDHLRDLGPDQCRDLRMPQGDMLSIPIARGLDGLLQKGCVISVAVNTQNGSVFYSLTPFGYSLANASRKLLARFTPEVRSEKPEGE
jgi:DNA-binding HxlR family transcriptional regulator